jgi:peptidoglycan/xylan/chitin deacetylase (PgdA/CDA1 family)
VTPWRVALTFDIEHPDRPTIAGTTERLLDTLDSFDVVATLFVQGRWAEAYPETARRIGASDHLVGSHSHYHVRMPLLTDAGIGEDLHDAEAAIRELAGAETRPWFRCPFGAGADDPRVLAAIATAGYRHVGWDVDGEDWQIGRTETALESEIVDGATRHGDGAIVLLHGWPSPTPGALPGIVTRLRDAGALFVRVDALVAR